MADTSQTEQEPRATEGQATPAAAQAPAVERQERKPAPQGDRAPQGQRREGQGPRREGGGPGGRDTGARMAGVKGDAREAAIEVTTGVAIVRVSTGRLKSTSRN